MDHRCERRRIVNEDLRKLSDASRLAHNDAILEGLPTVDIDTSDIIEAPDDSGSTR